jgi:hypothetical protein
MAHTRAVQAQISGEQTDHIRVYKRRASTQPGKRGAASTSSEGVPGGKVARRGNAEQRGEMPIIVAY